VTPDEAQAELENILIECSDVVSKAWVLDKLLARPELVLAALGAEQAGYQSGEWPASKLFHADGDWSLQDPSLRPVFVLPEGTENP